MKPEKLIELLKQALATLCASQEIIVSYDSRGKAPALKRN